VPRKQLLAVIPGVSWGDIPEPVRGILEQPNCFVNQISSSSLLLTLKLRETLPHTVKEFLKDT
jgi:hypothetical protein